MQLNKRLEVRVTPVAAKFHLVGKDGTIISPQAPLPASNTREGSPFRKQLSSDTDLFRHGPGAGFRKSPRTVNQGERGLSLSGSGLSCPTKINTKPLSSPNTTFLASSPSPSSPHHRERARILHHDIIEQKYMSQPFGCPESNTAFGAAYAEGKIPCRVDHSTKTKKLAWHSPPSSMETYNPLLVVLFQGILETNYPYTFIVREGIKDLLEAKNSHGKVLGVLRKLIKPLRDGLGSPDKEITIVSLNVFIQLVAVVGPAIVPFLQTLLSPLAPKALKREGGEIVIRTLQQVELIVVNFDNMYPGSSLRLGHAETYAEQDELDEEEEQVEESPSSTRPPTARSLYRRKSSAKPKAIWGANQPKINKRKVWTLRDQMETDNPVFHIIKAKLPTYLSSTGYSHSE